MSLPSLLGVFAHPDDEALLAGGVLAQHAAAGAATNVVTAAWSPTSHRAPELADALAALGAGKPRMLGYADARIPGSAPGKARLCDAPIDEVVELLVGHIRAARPQIVVTHDAYGQLTGHPDHVRTHQATVLAFHAAGLEHLHPDAGAPWQPVALYAATHPVSGVGELGPLLERVGKKVLSVPDEHATATVDVSEWLEQKWAAISAHRSEAAKERPLPGILSRLPAAERESIISTEHFTLLATRPAPAHRATVTEHARLGQPV
ncbi:MULTISPECIES: PIG-L deacetylase family protein [Streptomyces]|uniref:PIG-L deacetylase family protein n=1 Tax=Streptomyces TaxID=1883 RepID=UPI0024A4B5DF|nr:MULTISPECIES: PIG-L family deacetylase [Streptomyces]GLW02551.1 GlcNAc-PI de-N-acetylase [Streptomyces lavendulae subsp. lavendulae]